LSCISSSIFVNISLLPGVTSWEPEWNNLFVIKWWLGGETFRGMATKIIGLAIILPASLLLNLPLGMFRVRTKRFSLGWFISIHLAVPLIYFLRNIMGLSYWSIPILVVAAILGQFVGGRLGKKRPLRTVKLTKHK